MNEVEYFVGIIGCTLVFVFYITLMIIDWSKGKENQKRRKTDIIFIGIGVLLFLVAFFNEGVFYLVPFGLFMFLFILKYHANRT